MMGRGLNRGGFDSYMEEIAQMNAATVGNFIL
jgi:hypothetical protein